MDKKYIFIRDGVPEEVKPELWRWEAHYEDGEVLKQFADDGIFHQLAEIDQSKLHEFKMINVLTGQLLAMLFDGNRMKLVHFYRRYKTEADKLWTTIYVFGYELKGNSPVPKVLFFIQPNNSVVIAGEN